MSKKQSNQQAINEEDLLVTEAPKASVATEEDKLPTPHVGDSILFALRAINDGGEVQVFPGIVIEPKGTAASIKVFRGNFDEFFTKVPQSKELQAGFWTLKN